MKCCFDQRKNLKLWVMKFPKEDIYNVKKRHANPKRQKTQEYLLQRSRSQNEYFFGYYLKVSLGFFPTKKQLHSSSIKMHEKNSSKLFIFSCLLDVLFFRTEWYLTKTSKTKQFNYLKNAFEVLKAMYSTYSFDFFKFQNFCMKKTLLSYWQSGVISEFLDVIENVSRIIFQLIVIWKFMTVQNKNWN